MEHLPLLLAAIVLTLGHNRETLIHRRIDPSHTHDSAGPGYRGWTRYGRATIARNGSFGFKWKVLCLVFGYCFFVKIIPLLSVMATADSRRTLKVTSTIPEPLADPVLPLREIYQWQRIPCGPAPPEKWRDLLGTERGGYKPATIGDLVVANAGLLLCSLLSESCTCCTIEPRRRTSPGRGNHIPRGFENYANRLSCFKATFSFSLTPPPSPICLICCRHHCGLLRRVRGIFSKMVS